MLLYMTAELAQVQVAGPENVQASLFTCCKACCALAADASSPPLMQPLQLCQTWLAARGQRANLGGCS